MNAADRYVQENILALVVLQNSGHTEFNGVHRRTIAAMARRGMVHDLGEGRATVTEDGHQAVAKFYENGDSE